MEFLLIGDSKLKIVLDSGEMKKYKLECGYADDCNSGFRRSFWKILEMARESVGFDVGGDKVLIQFYPLASGGSEVFVTKLGLLSESSARTVERSERVTLLSKKRSMYLFSNPYDFAIACRIIRERLGEGVPESDAFSDGERIFLSIEEYSRGGEITEFPVIAEYGSAVSGELVPYVREHMQLLIKKDAVKAFSEL